MNYLKLFLKYPKDFLFSFVYSNKKKVDFFPYDPESEIIVNRLIKKIKNKRSDLIVNYVGSAKLKILGKKDIDILVGCPKEKFADYTKQLEGLFGKPTKKRLNFREWFYEYKDFSIEIRFDKLPSKYYDEMLRTFEYIGNNPAVLKIYIRFKEKSINKSIRQFALERIQFFDEVLPKKKKDYFWLYILYFICFTLVTFGLSIRGTIGNPSSAELLSSKWIESGPFELSPERGRFALTYSLVENKSFFFETNLARFSVPDLGIKNGNYVSLFAPAVSFLIVPGYIIGKALGAAQLGSTAVITLVAIINSLLIIYISKKFGVNIWASLFSAIVFLFATPAFAYAVNIYQHHVSTLLVLSGVALSLGNKTYLKLFFIWGICALSITVDYPNLFMLFPIGIYNLVRIFDKKIKKTVFYITTLCGLIMPILFFGWFNYNSYGNYLQLAGTVPGVAAIDANGNPAVPQNVTTENVEKFTRPEEAQNKNKSISKWFWTRNLLEGLNVHIISKDRGILYFTPIIVSGIFGLFMIANEQKNTKNNDLILNLLLGSILANILLYSMWGDPWGGWSFGSRYLIPSYALLAICTSLVIDKYAKNTLFSILFLIVFLYSVNINTLGAITTSAVPHKGDAQALEQITHKYERYSYDRNFEYLKNGNSKSVFFNEIANKYLSATQYYILLTAVISANALTIYFLLIKSYAKNK